MDESVKPAALGAGLLDRLPMRLQARVLERARLQHLPARAPVRAHGAWYGVVSGAVRLAAQLADGRAMTLELLGPGEFFGECLGGEGGSHEVETLGRCTLLVVPAETFVELMQTEPAFAQFVARLLSARLRAAHEAASQLLEDLLETRVARKLDELGRRFGVRVGDEIRITLPIIQRDVAELVGGSRQRVNVAMQALVRRGTLRLDARTRSIFLRPPQQIVAAPRKLML
ncbi:Crp/Fnr family transcriptional regulator [Pelomonas sp. KK5]|uniref:Crp/Fnr family transcriptional regulator n=1 Tax=Pelomonas sp. KK5 TaxID=1855730 RepID=UPI00097C89A7|nr:Crp/Fnr family transcriptional regulator [Pelomonas sp. KK5]